MSEVKMRLFRVLLLAVAAAAALVLPARAQSTVQIDGAGATFPYPIYSKWFSEYNKIHSNVQINYQSIGSGGGIRQLTNPTVFFRAPPRPLTHDPILAPPGEGPPFPTVP